MSRKRDNYEISRWKKFRSWVDGETDPLEHGMEAHTAVPRKEGMFDSPDHEKAVREELARLYGDSDKTAILRARGIRYFQRFYKIMSVVLCLGIILVLLWTVASLPVTGVASNPDNNEVAARYIERGLQETGAVNIVTGMILDYRAFDTFGESCVLFFGHRVS